MTPITAILRAQGGVLGEAAARLVDDAKASDAIDAQTAALIEIALLSVTRAPDHGVAAQVRQAALAGCRRAEMIDAILLTSLYGAPAAAAALHAAVAEMDRLKVT